ncbi:DMT family transporter [Saccharomonospora xinjiangensis]|uniref:Putative permease, DMT superfamily n=1 Tax=Saccharomonospora xinjiangensis XJ-54 TaxID=882086 RepID=I0V663_9PSEU|nr:EamA family transporter [Saccharomonospora xinjiangensis]EID55616.1 putative permease, DMT superfamily [Saccharomonospora xinjiangensis XJ-54]
MSTIDAAPSRAATASLITAGILWGTGGLAGAMLSERAGWSSVAIAVCRLALGGVFALLLLGCAGGLRSSGFLPRTGAAFRRLLTAGALLALYQACYFAAVTLTSVSVATMTTIGSVPVFVALAGAVGERRLPDRVTMASIACAVLGLVLLTWSPSDAEGGGQLVLGLACALASGAGFATLTIVNGKPVEGLDPLRTTAFGCLVGAVLLLPLLALSATPQGAALWPLRTDVIAVAIYLGAVPTALAYGAYFRGLAGARPVVAALSALLEPLTAAVLAAVLLGDDLGVVGWCGAVLLVGAVAGSYVRPATPR